KLKQLIVNLAANALKFTSQGLIELKVATLEETAVALAGRIEKVNLLFSIRDTGVGIPENRIGVIFDSFIQGDSSTTKKYGGTGLGLAICKGIAELMGGSIWVKSKLGEGSTFYFSAKFDTVLGVPEDHLIGMAHRSPAQLK
ncbi:MAG: hybrid sensor histidine kinase/response regulator, partial [Deltaproteobacteria bacterium]|nr:hybrid sensor histidine kinase/response regulator [Deltaproteobacteria bacterium]